MAGHAWVFCGFEPRHRGRVFGILGLPEPTPQGPAALAMVEAEIQQAGKTTLARRNYLASALLTAGRFAVAVRTRWRIENSLR